MYCRDIEPGTDVAGTGHPPGLEKPVRSRSLLLEKVDAVCINNAFNGCFNIYFTVKKNASGL